MRFFNQQGRNLVLGFALSLTTFNSILAETSVIAETSVMAKASAITKVSAVNFNLINLSNITLSKIAPKLSSEVANLAIKTISCATKHEQIKPKKLAIIDYSLPSTEPRFWLIDLKNQNLLLEELVAHGRGSGDNHANSFSNVPGSLSSSLGLFRVTEPYIGAHGLSIRLAGLEQGFNDLAYERAIVIHGANYVSPDFIANHKRLGRSWGCPALSPQAAQKAIKYLKDTPSYLFSYYPDTEWIKKSPYLNGCQEQTSKS
jgi:hypothetical protein